MSRTSTRMLERHFFKAFFASLVQREHEILSLTQPETDLRFERSYGVLLAVEDPSPSLIRLLDSLRADPVSGTVRALHANLLRLQPGVVSIPNPTYGYATLQATDDGAEHLAEVFGNGFPEAFEQAVEAFLADNDVSHAAREPDAPSPT